MRATNTRAAQLLSIGLLIVPAFLSGPSRAAEKGDVNADGSLDAADVLLLRQAVADGAALNSEQAEAADVAPLVGGAVQPDGAVDGADLSLLLRVFSGIDVDGDGLDIGTERDAATSPFALDSDGDGTNDSGEDSDADGLSNLDEQSLGSSAADPLGLGDPDPGYVAPVPSDPYPPGTGPKVVFYASRPSANLARMAPLKDLLSAAGYQLEDFSAPPPTTIPASTNGGRINCVLDPTCYPYAEAMFQASILVIPEPDEPITAAEALTFAALSYYYGVSWLVLSEGHPAGAEAVTALGGELVGQAAVHASPSCPDGMSSCPLGWTTFRPGNGSLLANHATVQGRNTAELVSALTTFSGAAFDVVEGRSMPDTRNLVEYQQVATLPAGTIARDEAGTLSVAGLGQGIAYQTPDDLCGITATRGFLSGDIEAFTALVDAGGARGLQILAPDSNPQFVLNLSHWLDGSLDPPGVPLWERRTTSWHCGGSQRDDPFYDPVVSNPSYPIGTGPRILVDSAHGNASTLTFRYEGFARLLERDGYQLEDSPALFDSAEFETLIAGARMLVIVNPTVAIEAAEFQPVVDDFVANGGSLLYVIDHKPFNERVANSAPLLGINFPTGLGRGVGSAPTLCTPYGSGCLIGNILFARDTVSDGEGTITPGHPVTEGGPGSTPVDLVRAYHGSGFEELPSAPSIGTHTELFGLPSTAVFMGVDPPNPAPGLLQGMEIEIGTGRVFVSAEAGMFTAQIQGITNLLDESGDPVLDPYGDPVQVGYGAWGINAEPSNEQLLLNVVRRLDGLL